jgi:hypothetical protein
MQSQFKYVDDNILTKYYFPRHMEKRKRSETGFIALISSCTLLFGEGWGRADKGLWKLL